MYTAACSVKGWPQKRAGAVETFLKTFVSASRWISLSVVRKKRLSPKYRACSPVLLVAVLSCLVLTECLDTVDSLICCFSLALSRSYIPRLEHKPTSHVARSLSLSPNRLKVQKDALSRSPKWLSRKLSINDQCDSSHLAWNGYVLRSSSLYIINHES